jgi:tRNA(Met) cytidine acetyltransferase
VSQPRRCLVLRGPAAEIRAAARAATAAITPWFGPVTALGGTLREAVVDLTDGLDLDRLAAVAGFVGRGGRLVVLLPQTSADPRLAVWPYAPTDVGSRTLDRVAAALADLDGPTTVAPADLALRDQDRAVAALRGALASGQVVVLTAGRGRGKSAALGRVLADWPGALCTAADPDDTATLRAFAPSVPFVPWEVVLAGPPPPVLAVDEAARLPVAVLQRLATLPRVAFATTTGGYEGTGGGFALRFLPRLRAARPVSALTLRTPLRWDAGDPLARALDRALLADATPAPWPAPPHPDETTVAAIDRDRLAADAPLLREVFGLLTHAHYRTTPSDLHRLLDAPNLQLYALLAQGRPVAVNWIAREGGLPPDAAAAAQAGRGRLRGHALADLLATHGGSTRAGALRWVRSVRIATHPDARGRGLGARLAAGVHAAEVADGFGTLFGATPDLVAFRRQQGYRPVFLAAGLGARSGAPAVAAVRPVHPDAAALTDALQAELARDLPLRLRLLAADTGLPVDPALPDALALPPAPPRALADAWALAASWVDGPRALESVAGALAQVLTAAPDWLAGTAERGWLTARVVDARPWTAIGVSPGPAVRAIKRAWRAAARRE